MTQRLSPPFRADHVGSLLRPANLLAARAAFKAGTLPADELRAIEDEAILAVVQMQEEIGLQLATDGEFRRTSWHMDFIYSLGGIIQTEDKIHVKFHNAEGDLDYDTPATRVAGRIVLNDTIFADHFTYLQQCVTTATPKLTIPSPNMVHYRGGRAAIDETVYPDLDAFWSDLTAAYRDEVQRLGALGCTYLQLDDTSLAYLNDPTQREYIAGLGGDAERQHLTYIRLINSALAKRPPGMTICTHMCRGNFRSSWVATGGYDYVAETLFGELK